MSFQDFQQLPPFTEGVGQEELPALWEDGGGEVGERGRRREGYGTAPTCRPRFSSDSHDDSVMIFNDDDNDSNHHHHHHHNDVADADTSPPPPPPDGSLEQKSSLIEETLSQIYASPFQQLIYASSQQSSSSSSSSSSSAKHSSNPPKSVVMFRESSFSSSPSPVGGGKSVGVGGADSTEGGGGDGGGGGGGGGGSPEGRVRLQNQDVHRTMKASIARAAQKAVSGYRTCDDADSYVGTRFKPTLILARAPPSPSGILRRTSKKTSTVKVTTGSVRWADVRPANVPSADDSST